MEEEKDESDLSGDETLSENEVLRGPLFNSFLTFQSETTQLDPKVSRKAVKASRCILREMSISRPIRKSRGPKPNKNVVAEILEEYEHHSE